MNVTLKIWRQKNADTAGTFETHQMDNVSPDQSLLEVLDELNAKLEEGDKAPFVFESDCREGICGTCNLYINGKPHGPGKGMTTCQLHMRSFSDGDIIVIEPWRASAFPIKKDLMVDRTGLDKIIQAGGYISINTGGVPDANAIPIPQADADHAFDVAACIGCGACVAACKNASASLFTAAKISQLASLPQGKVERTQRVISMVEAMDEAGFGHCSNEGECEAACPKEITMENISHMNREYIMAKVKTFGK